jgi:hypothetical protein
MGQGLDTTFCYSHKVLVNGVTTTIEYLRSKIIFSLIDYHDVE